MVDVLPAAESESASTVYPNHIGLHIIEFGGFAASWGSATSIGKIAQTGWGIGDMMVSSVAVKLNNASGATDDVTLSLHHMAHFGIPEELPAPDTLDVIASATVSGADIGDDWPFVLFEFSNPVTLPYDWSFVLERSEPSDTETYGFWANNFANFNTGYVWVTLPTGWNTGGSGDMSMTIYQPYYTAFDGFKHVSSQRGPRRFSSSENKTSTSTAAIGTQG